MNNTPKIRYKGYTDAWEQRKLGEISDKITKKNQDIAVEEVFTNSAEFGIISQRDFFDKDIANAENIDGYYVVEPDDFVYNPRISTTAPFGPIKRNKLERTGAMSPLYYVFRPHDIDLSYLEWLFQTTCWHSFMRFNGNSGARSDRFAITDKIFNEMPISMPQDIEEQKKLGTFFTELDNLITFHQRKCDGLKNTKKFMLQKMFPKNGEQFPEIRFSGFTDAWEQRKLSDITSKIGSGKTPLGGKEAYVEDGVCLIRSQNVYDDKVDLTDVVYIDEETDNSMSNSRVTKGDVLLNITGASIGRSAVYTGVNSANVNQHVCIIRPVEGYESRYIQLNISSSNGQRQIESSQAGGGREGLNFQQIGKMSFMFPKSEEQQKIGEFFSSLDNLITFHQRKSDQLKMFKKFMLQNMFP